MTDEEKKALRNFKSEYETCVHYSSDLIIELDDAEILLNLIEKQSKEIEHQKEKRENQKKELAILNAKQVEFNKLVNTVNSYKGQFKRQQKEIENECKKCRFKKSGICEELCQNSQCVQSECLKVLHSLSR